MAKRKKPRRLKLKSWCSARFSCDDLPFLTIGLSLLECNAFQTLKASSRIMYLLMALLCRGSAEFEFSRSVEERYFSKSHETAETSKKRLLDKGFISVTEKRAFKSTVYVFSDCWKTPPGDEPVTTPRKISADLTAQKWTSIYDDGKEEKIMQVGKSLFECDQFQDLSFQARMVYLSMAMEAGASIRFMFAPAVAKKYGFSKSTLHDAVRELERENFIERDEDDPLRPGAYRFCLRWKREASIGGKPINPIRV